MLLVVPVVACAIIAVEIAIATQRDYITEAEFEVDFVASGQAPELRMAVLGDSTVAGLGASSERTSLPAQIARKVAKETGRSVRVIGFGVSGAITEDVLKQQLANIEPGEFDVIVIEVGSNDVTHRTGLASLQRHTRSVLVRSKELAPVVVMGSSGRLNSPNFLPPLRQIVMLRATSVRKRQVRVARELDVPIVDIAKDVSPTYDATAGSNSRDAFHPSDVGYEIWARPLAERVVAALGVSDRS